MTRTVSFIPRGGTEQLTKLVIVLIRDSQVARVSKSRGGDFLLGNRIDSSEFRLEGLAHRGTSLWLATLMLLAVAPFASH